MSKRGGFIVIEGLDRSGKSTQTSLLYDRLKLEYDASQSGSVHLLKFPGQYPKERKKELLGLFLTYI